MLDGIDEILELFAEVFGGIGKYLKSFTLGEICGGVATLGLFFLFYLVMILV